jgi:hypothetical protein
MKKSKSVPATFVAGLAAAYLAGCSGGQTAARQCVDAYGNPIPDIQCRSANSQGVVIGHYGVPGGGGYYGGNGFYGGSRGGTVSGGSVSTGSSVSSVSRGGFGGAGRGFGGFGGG